MKKLSLFLLLLSSFAFAQEKSIKVSATNEQTLEVRNLLLAVQAKQQEARALKAETAIAEAEAIRLDKEVKPLLDAIMDKLKLDKSKYVASIEDNKLVFVLKSADPAPTPKP